MAELSSKLPPRGGSDIMEEGLRKRINLDDYNVNLILSRCTEDQIDTSKKNVLWQHLNYNEPLTQGMTNKFFTRCIDAYVYVSHWQHEKFRYVYHIPVENAFVIKNSIEPIEYIPRKKGEKIRLIYTSAPFRGLNVLLDAFELLNRDDIELYVYSSTIVYGTDYDNVHSEIYEPLFERARNMKNVYYMGYAKNTEIIKALQSSHIFAYPTMFEETCCLAMIEAGAAGCKIVSHNLGAVYETGSEFARLIPIRIEADELASEYAKALNEEIDSYWEKTDLLKWQSDFYNNFYSWDKRKVEWETLFSRLI